MGSFKLLAAAAILSSLSSYTVSSPVPPIEKQGRDFNSRFAPEARPVFPRSYWENLTETEFPDFPDLPDLPNLPADIPVIVQQTPRDLEQVAAPEIQPRSEVQVEQAAPHIEARSLEQPQGVVAEAPTPAQLVPREAAPAPEAQAAPQAHPELHDRNLLNKWPCNDPHWQPNWPDWADPKWLQWWDKHKGSWPTATGLPFPGNWPKHFCGW